MGRLLKLASSKLDMKVVLESKLLTILNTITSQAHRFDKSGLDKSGLDKSRVAARRLIGNTLYERTGNLDVVVRETTYEWIK